MARAADLPESSPVTVQVDSRQIALFKTGGDVFAMDNACPHKGAPLGQGTVEGGKIFCPMHGWEFDIRTGICADRPDRPAKCIPVRVVDGQVQIQL